MARDNKYIQNAGTYLRNLEYNLQWFYLFTLKLRITPTILMEVKKLTENRLMIIV